ncbi:MAG TPA: WD40 repeat domain-containing protein, partial [Blastocatellia bacterium]|nr:WD40 repeat domain-containing protein [Blastocatellia bacterium]
MCRNISSTVYGTSLAVIIVLALSSTQTAFARWTQTQQPDRGIKLKPGESKSGRPGKKNAGGERPELILQTGHSVKVDAMAFSPDGLYIATGGVDKTIKIWDVAEGRELRTLAGHTGGVKAVAFSPGSPAVSQDRSLIASGGNDGRIILWETASGKEVAAFAAHASAVTSIAFSRDGRWLASGGADFKVKLWNLATRSEARRFDGHYRLVTSVAFSPDGAWLASGGADEVIRLWDLSKIESSKSKNLNIEPILLEGHTGWVRSLDFSPDGGMLASSGA